MKSYAKAVVAALIAGLTAAGTALTDETMTSTEWTVVVVATLVALGAVWGVPNAQDPAAE